MGAHPCRGRGNREEQSGHITITNHSYHHGCASLQRERQQRGTIRTHYNNQSQLSPWVRIPAEGEATERNSQSQDTNYNNQSQLPPSWVGISAEGEPTERNSQSQNTLLWPITVTTIMGGHPCRGRGNREEQPITGHITITNHSYHHGCAMRIPEEGAAIERKNPHD